MSIIRNGAGDFSELPIRSRERVELAHGGGGELMQEIITQVFAAGLDAGNLQTESDAAVLSFPEGGRLAFATDSFVVKPLFFPGGDIGTLAVNSTVNDLAMVGARPLYLSTAFILEEGLPLVTLDQVVASMHKAAQAVGVHVVTGDTKVVDRGAGDLVYINTTGVGVIEGDRQIGPRSVQSGDAILVNGDVGRHGIAVLSVRQELGFHTQVQSDSAPLFSLVQTLLEADIDVHCMRDLTRGGLASALIEIARTASLDIDIAEGRVPVSQEVAAVCELMGLDPMYVANEGRLVVFVPADQADAAKKVMKAHPQGRGTRRIGTVGKAGKQVRLRTSIGTRRILDRRNGEKLPRVC